MTIQDAGLSFPRPLYKRKRITTHIILHHAAGYGSVEDIHRFHLGKGWNGIAYNFYVRLDGSVWRGKGWKNTGGHTGGCDKNGIPWNEQSIGICAEGNFETNSMPQEQENAIVELLAMALARYPGVEVVGHRDVNPTACPGRNYPFERIVSRAKETLKMGKFVDTAGHFAEEDIEEAREAGIVNGRTEVEFDPDSPITRAESVAIVMRNRRHLIAEILELKKELAELRGSVQK